MSTSVARKRLLAVFVGLALVVLFFAGLLYWNQSYVHGEESCTRCGRERTVDRRGPFWFRSRVHLVGDVAGAQPEVECAHEWQRVGCWQVDGGFSLYGAPHVTLR